MSISYLYARVLKKLRGTAIRSSTVHPTSKLEAGSQFVNSTMAKHSFCGYDCSILNCDVGAFCSIASRVTIGGIAHPMHFVSTSPVFLSHRDSVKAKFSRHDYLPTIRTTIGNDVWIGDGTFIKAGISIGDGAVVGMGSVVTKDVAPYAIVAGNPARLVRYRFEPEVIQALLRMAWWNLDDHALARVATQFDRPIELLRQEGFL